MIYKRELRQDRFSKNPFQIVFEFLDIRRMITIGHQSHFFERSLPTCLNLKELQDLVRARVKDDVDMF